MSNTEGGPLTSLYMWKTSRELEDEIRARPIPPTYSRQKNTQHRFIPSFLNKDTAPLFNSKQITFLQLFQQISDTFYQPFYPPPARKNKKILA